MYLTEYNPEKERQRTEFLVRGDEHERVATDMLRDGEPLTKIIKYSRLAEDAILTIAKNLGISVTH